MKAFDTLSTYWHILKGPAGPYLPGKLADLVRRPVRRGWAQRALAQTVSVPCHHLGLPLPPEGFLQRHRHELLDWAAHQASRSMATTGRDPRDVLEIARMHPWALYAVAAHLSGESRWFETFAKEVEAFHQDHPPLRGPLWSVAMDSAIRAVNLLVAWDWFAQAGMHNDALDKRIATIAREHAIAIWGTLETAGGMGTSHLLGDLVGLVVIEAYLGTAVTPEGSVLPWLERETARQMLPDGMNFEASTGYHRQVADLLRVARDVAMASPILQSRLSVSFLQTVSTALQAQAALQSCGMPLIGDNDDGLCIKLLPTPLLMVPLDDTVPTSGNFSDFGLWLRPLDTAILTLRNGPVGQHGKGGHAHNDLNAITLSVRGHPVLVDPGTAVYTANPQRRNRDRSTAVHATVLFPGCEQRSLFSEMLFWMVEPSGTRGPVQVDDGQWTGIVCHGGNRKYQHRRTVQWHDRQLVVHDNVSALPAKIMVPLAPEAVVQVHGQSATISVASASVELSWTNAAVEPLTLLHTAPAYGVTVNGSLLVLAMLDTDCTWSIRW